MSISQERISRCGIAAHTCMRATVQTCRSRSERRKAWPSSCGRSPRRSSRSCRIAGSWERSRWRTRLLTAAADVHNPDAEQRRRWSKASRRREKAEKLRRDEEVLADAGIRLLRNKPVFTTPDPPRPAVSAQTEVEDDPEFREVVELQHCYVCKQRYLTIHHFYDQLCPSCGDFNYAKRGETTDLSGRESHRRTRR